MTISHYSFKKGLYIALFLSILLSIFLPLAISAQTPPIPPYNPPGSIGSGESAVMNLLVRVARIFGSALMGIAVIMILWAAFKYLTARGDDTALTSARNTLIYALVGVAVALLAFALPAMIRGLIQ